MEETQVPIWLQVLAAVTIRDQIRDYRAHNLAVDAQIDAFSAAIGEMRARGKTEVDAENQLVLEAADRLMPGWDELGTASNDWSLDRGYLPVLAVPLAHADDAKGDLASYYLLEYPPSLNPDDSDLPGTTPDPRMTLGEMREAIRTSTALRDEYGDDAFCQFLDAVRRLPSYQRKLADLWDWKETVGAETLHTGRSRLDYWAAADRCWDAFVNRLPEFLALVGPDAEISDEEVDEWVDAARPALVEAREELQGLLGISRAADGALRRVTSMIDAFMAALDLYMDEPETDRWWQAFTRVLDAFRLDSGCMNEFIAEVNIAPARHPLD
jgi:hypothetical protein